MSEGTPPAPGDLAAAREVLLRIRDTTALLAREIEQNGNISPDLTGRLAADAGVLARMAAAAGN